MYNEYTKKKIWNWIKSYVNIKDYAEKLGEYFRCIDMGMISKRKMEQQAVYLFFGNDCKVQTFDNTHVLQWILDICIFTKKKNPKRKCSILMWFGTIQFDCMSFSIFNGIPYEYPIHILDSKTETNKMGL